MESLNDFHLFPRLPYDIQHEIWKHASNLVKARIVNIYFHNSGKFTTDAPCPPLLHVCQASRNVMLRDWLLSFSVTKNGARGHPNEECGACIPFNFAIDTLCFEISNIDVGDVGLLVKFEERKRIQRVAYALGNCEYPGEWNGFTAEWPEKMARALDSTFPNLATLKWVFGRRRGGWSYYLNLERPGHLTPEPISYNEHWGLKTYSDHWEEMETYSDHWEEMELDEGMLPHYLQLNDFEPGLDLHRQATYYKLLPQVYNNHPELNCPHFSFALPMMKIISAEQDSWGYDLCNEIEEEKRMRAKKDATEKRLQEVRCEIGKHPSGSKESEQTFAELKELAKRHSLLSYLDGSEHDKKERIHAKTKPVVQHLHKMRFQKRLQQLGQRRLR